MESSLGSSLKFIMKLNLFVLLIILYSCNWSKEVSSINGNWYYCSDSGYGELYVNDSLFEWRPLELPFGKLYKYDRVNNKLLFNKEGEGRILSVTKYSFELYDVKYKKTYLLKRLEKVDTIYSFLPSYEIEEKISRINRTLKNRSKKYNCKLKESEIKEFKEPDFNLHNN